MGLGVQMNREWVDSLLVEQKKRQTALAKIQDKIKYAPLVVLPYEDRDLMRFPSIMDDRKQFDKLKYIE